MEPFIIDAHTHTGYPNIFFSPEVDSRALLERMDLHRIKYSINLCSMRTLQGYQSRELRKAQQEFEDSAGRIFYCGFYDPRRLEKDIELLKKAVHRTGFKGVKIHPSFNKNKADDDCYEPVWKFASDFDIPIVAHTWSVSSYNPSQVLSTPEKFERYVKEYPQVRFVLAHSGGRGTGRFEAIRMVNEYENVYMDFGGDIYCYQYFEKMARKAPKNKILFGTDYPWFDQRTHLSRVYLADISTDFKRKIFRDNALEVYRLE